MSKRNTYGKVNHITSRVKQSAGKPRFFVKVCISPANDRAAAHPETLGRISMIPPKPERFEILCHDIGLSLLLGQKVQFALACYFGVNHAVRAGWNKSQLEEKVRYFLSRPMGAVVSEIKRKAPLPDELSAKIDEFKTLRNWLVHDFDEEATPYISRGQKIDDYIARMEQITNLAMDIMNELDKIGDELMREKGFNPLEIKRIAEERRNSNPTIGST